MNVIKTNNFYKYLISFVLLFLFSINIVKAHEFETVMTDLSSLETLAENYKSESGVQTETKLLVTTFIRDGAYDESWNEYGGIRDNNFEQYVVNNNSNLTYLKNVYNIATPSGDTIDFKRLMSNLNILLNRGSLFGNWISDIYDLTVIIAGNNVRGTADEIANTYYNSFSSQGCVTNMDSYNLYKLYGNRLSDSLRGYYSSITKDERIRQFTTNLGVASFSREAIRTSVLANFKSSDKIIELLNLKGISFENNGEQIIGANYAYADYIYLNHPNRALVSEIKFDKEEIFLDIGEEIDLNITTTPAVDFSLLKITSSSPEVVSIVSGKTVRAISEGTSTITCSCGGISKTLKINVVGYISNISFETQSINIKAGSAIKLEPIVTPKENLDYSFSSSNPEIADVDENGNIFSFKAGKTFITCKSNRTPSIYAQCELIISQPIEQINLKNTELTLRKGDSSKLNITIVPKEHTDHLIYSSADETIAKVDTSGNITAVGAGQTIITCTSEENPEIKAICNVIVAKMIEKIYFERDFVTIDLAESNQVKFNVFMVPNTANTTHLTYEVSDSSIATLDSRSMIITVLKKGSFSITCKSKDDPTVSAKCNFYVLNTQKEEPTPTVNKDIQYDKEDIIEVDTIIDKNDTIVEEKEENPFNVNFFKKIIIALIIIAIIIVIVGSSIINFFNKNKNKLKELLGFEKDFEDEYDTEIEENSDKERITSVYNLCQVKYQTEEDSLKMKEELEAKDKLSRINQEETYEDILKETEEQRKKDIDDFD